MDNCDPKPDPLTHEEMEALCVFDTPAERDAAKRYAAYAEKRGVSMPVPICRHSSAWESPIDQQTLVIKPSPPDKSFREEVALVMMVESMRDAAKLAEWAMKQGDDLPDDVREQVEKASKANAIATVAVGMTDALLRELGRGTV